MRHLFPFPQLRDHHRRPGRRRFQPDLSTPGGGTSALEARALLSALGAVDVRATVRALRVEDLGAAPAQAQVQLRRADRPVIPQAIRSGLISQSDALIYIPPGVKPGRKVPLLVVFDPLGNASTSIRTWKSQAVQRHWIIYASKEFSDASIAPSGPIMVPATATYKQILAEGYRNPNLLATVKAHIDAAVARSPVDPSRIILAGFSGGAFISHDLNASYPGFAAAVIDNSNGEPLIGEIPPDFVDGVPTAASFANSRREAVFLVGQGDTLFLHQVEQTIPAYQQWGWQTFFRTYPGGHKPAPTNLMKLALKWLVKQPTWA